MPTPDYSSYLYSAPREEQFYYNLPPEDLLGLLGTVMPGLVTQETLDRLEDRYRNSPLGRSLYEQSKPTLGTSQQFGNLSDATLEQLADPNWWRSRDQWAPADTEAYRWYTRPFEQYAANKGRAASDFRSLYQQPGLTAETNIGTFRARTDDQGKTTYTPWTKDELRDWVYQTSVDPETYKAYVDRDYARFGGEKNWGRYGTALDMMVDDLYKQQQSLSEQYGADDVRSVLPLSLSNPEYTAGASKYFNPTESWHFSDWGKLAAQTAIGAVTGAGIAGVLGTAPAAGAGGTTAGGAAAGGTAAGGTAGTVGGALADVVTVTPAAAGIPETITVLGSQIPAATLPLGGAMLGGLGGISTGVLTMPEEITVTAEQPPERPVIPNEFPPVIPPVIPDPIPEPDLPPAEGELSFEDLKKLYFGFGGGGGGAGGGGGGPGGGSIGLNLGQQGARRGLSEVGLPYAATDPTAIQRMLIANALRPTRTVGQMLYGESGVPSPQRPGENPIWQPL